MTVDGPEIGTLVVIVDRAKNLPNRKSIGKQDPYCAARLGKEAKKTETDRRGGQTPRWDQELRFTVHDSPDYYQLKVSVFNDDKKTEIIGETWVNLQEVIVPGGGQNDLWHNLNCKGKYAGEVRIEITYYDSRPKQEKAEKIRQTGANGVDDGGRDSLKGPRQPKAPVKRRPLPSDPVTGARPPQADDSPPRAYQPPSAVPEHVQTQVHGYQTPSYIPNHSPLQNVEYYTPPPRMPQPQGYAGSPNLTGNTNGYGTSPDVFSTSPTARQFPNDRYETYGHAPNGHTTNNQNNYGHGYDRYGGGEEHVDQRDLYDSGPAPYELPQPEDFDPPPSPGGPPPPPPAHRSRNGSQHVSPAPAMTSHDSYGFPSDRGSSNLHETPSHDMHRHSMPAYTQLNSYQAYTPPADQDQFRRSANAADFEQSPPRHHSYDSRYHGNYGSMQPTVEDAPPTPGPGNNSGQRGSGSRSTQYYDRRYDQVPSPAPLNLNGRESAASRKYSVSTVPSTQHSNGYGSTNSPASFRDQSVSSQTSYSTLPTQQRRISDEPVGGSPSPVDGYVEGYGLPPVPPTLVAGIDPNIAQEISDRIYADKRASYNQSVGNSSRGRFDSPPYQSSRPHPFSYQETAQPFVPAATTYDERQSRIATATVPIVKPRAISPDPRSPVRKSVSPAAPSPDKRRLSGVPFGPDSYNSLNPSLSGSTSTPSLSAKYDPNEPDPDAKIITHDGREVDPSDHIPESNYAPLLESKGPKYASQQPDRNYRPSPNGRQPNPSTGRTPLRQAAPRPQSMAASSPIQMSGGISEPSTPQNGRNRLQKKVNRMSAQPAPHSSPLAPISAYQDNTYAPSPRSLPRQHPGDYSNENYAPQQYGSSPGYRGTAAPPPIPAKIPVGPHAPPPHPNSADAWALLEEMKNIDLGNGRARRRGGR